MLQTKVGGSVGLQERLRAAGTIIADDYLEYFSYRFWFHIAAYRAAPQIEADFWAAVKFGQDRAEQLTALAALAERQGYSPALVGDYIVDLSRELPPLLLAWADQFRPRRVARKRGRQYQRAVRLLIRDLARELIAINVPITYAKFTRFLLVVWEIAELAGGSCASAEAFAALAKTELPNLRAELARRAEIARRGVPATLLGRGRGRNPSSPKKGNKSPSAS